MATYPFSEINSRIFYACQAVLVKERNDQEGDTSPVDGTYLTGVTGVGVNGSFPSVSLADIGRAQRKHHFYAPQDFDITIERRLDKSSSFFYTSNGYAPDAYTSTHILNDENIGMQGGANDADKSLKNYDITILYGPDKFDRLGSDYDGTGGDADKVFSVTYRNCLITSISYSIGVDAITESITLITRGVTYNDSHQNVNSYTLPGASSAQSGDVIKRSDFDLLESSTDSVLPTEVTKMFKAQVTGGGFDTLDGEFILGINSITIDVGIDYSEIKDIGQWAGGFTPTGGAYDQGKQNVWRYVNLPVAITAAFTGTVRQPFVQDLPITDTTFSAANGVASSTDWTQVDREIKLVAKTFPAGASTTYFVWDLGKRNYLTDFSFSGGDAGGGNLEATMSYQNDFSDIVLVKDTSVHNFSPSKVY